MSAISRLALVTLLAACGKSSSESAPAASGTIMGSPFTPTDSGALATAATTCNFGPPIGSRSMTVLAMGFTSFANVCGFVQTAGLCGDVASSLVVSATILNAPASGTASPVGPGTYAIGTHVDGNNNIVDTDASITKVSPTCVSAPGIPNVQSGSITISATSPRVNGSLDVTFTDGSHFAGAFDLSLCSASVDFCTLVTGGCATRVCCSAPTSCP